MVCKSSGSPMSRSRELLLCWSSESTEYMSRESVTCMSSELGTFCQANQRLVCQAGLPCVDQR